MHTEYLKQIEQQKEEFVSSATTLSKDDWQNDIQLDLANELTAKWRNWSIIIAIAAVLLIIVQATWYYTHPKYVGGPIQPDKPYTKSLNTEAQIEEKFLQMTNVLRYLVDEVKKHDKALLRTETLSESKSTTKMPSFMRAEVTTSKANVRPVPNISSEPIMTLDKGTKLLVDLRQDEWNRVVTPTGQRAWMSSKVMELEGAS